MIFSIWVTATDFVLTFAPAAIVWTALYLSAASIRRHLGGRLSSKLLRIGLSAFGFFVCFVIALLIRGLFDPTSHQPIGATPMVQALILYFWLDPTLKSGKADTSFAGVLAFVFTASALLVFNLQDVIDTYTKMPEPSQAEPSQRSQGESVASGGDARETQLDPSCRTEVLNGLAVINCE